MNNKTNKYFKKPGGSNFTQDCGGNRFVLKKQKTKKKQVSHTNSLIIKMDFQQGTSRINFSQGIYDKFLPLKKIHFIAFFYLRNKQFYLQLNNCAISKQIKGEKKKP